MLSLYNILYHLTYKTLLKITSTVYSTTLFRMNYYFMIVEKTDLLERLRLEKIEIYLRFTHI